MFSNPFQIAILVCAVSIGLLWVATDPRPWREQFTFSSANMYGRVGYFIAIFIAGWMWLPLQLSESTESLLIVAGTILFFAGSVLLVWTKKTMGTLWGPPAQLDTARQTTLITSGPFAFSRNPIYLGIILAGLGYALAFVSWLSPLIVLLVWYFNRAARIEEKLLEAHFGNEYTVYKSHVRRYL